MNNRRSYLRSAIAQNPTLKVLNKVMVYNRPQYIRKFMQEMIRFFDFHAQNWDSYYKGEEFTVIRKILERSDLNKNDILLDIACGTGILVPFFLEWGISASSIQGIDISPKMIEIFSQKFPEIKVTCADFMTALLPKEFFSYTILFNSFPHFLEPEKVFIKVSQLLKPQGKLIIAHSKTREEIDQYHAHVQGVVQSHRLITNDLFLQYYKKYGFRDIILDNTSYFFTMGRKK